MSSNPTMSARSAAELTVRSWPIVDEPRRTWPLPAVLAGVAGVVWLATASGWLSLLAGGAMMLSMWRIWMPIRFDIAPGGLRQRVLRWQQRIAWPAIGRYELRDHGVLLLADQNAAPIDAARGLWIPYAGRRDQVVELVRRYAIYAQEVPRP